MIVKRGRGLVPTYPISNDSDDDPAAALATGANTGSVTTATFFERRGRIHAFALTSRAIASSFATFAFYRFLLFAFGHFGSCETGRWLLVAGCRSDCR